MSVPEPIAAARSEIESMLPEPAPPAIPTVLAAALVGMDVATRAGAGDDGDLLLEVAVAAGSVERLATVLRGLGFVTARDEDDRRWLVAFDGEGGRWIRILVGDHPSVPEARTRDAARSHLRGPRGLMVALLGPDGTGKSTLATAIAASFPFPARVVYMGLWQRQRRRERPLLPGGDLVPRILFAWRRYLVGRYHRARGRLVVFDRYVYDAAAGLPDAKGRVTRAYLWLLSRSCPAPDLVLLLDSPGAVAFARKGEHDVAQLDRDRRRFLALAAHIPRIEVVDADRPCMAVQADATSRIWQRYTVRRG